ELAARVVLGQQVTVDAGRRLAGQLVRLCGAPVPKTTNADGALTRAFPTAARVAGADLAQLKMPKARQRALLALALAAQSDPLLFEPLETVEKTVARLCAIDGVGEWTAHCIALRAAREPDAFPVTDIALLRGAASRIGEVPSPSELLERA